MEDYTFYDFATPRKGKKIIGRIARISNRAGSRRISFSKEISDEIKEIKPCKLRLRRDNITGDVHMIFNPEIGLAVHFPYEGKKSTEANSIEAVTLLSKFFNQEGATFDLFLSENLANDERYKTYRLNPACPDRQD